MASIPFSATKTFDSPTYMTLLEKFDHVKHDHSTFMKVNFTNNKSQKRDLTIANVATKHPTIAPPARPPPTSTVQHERKLVAWTSVRQESWQGELEVEGEIPLWLVCQTVKT